MDAFWAALAGIVVYLDTTAVAQIMICQPLIICPLWGLAAGQPEIGILFGTAFQLLWLGNLPVGSAKFPEGNVGALVATAIAVKAAGNGLDWSILAAAALTGVITARGGAEVTNVLRRILAAHAPRIVTAAAAGDAGRFNRLFWGAVGLHATAGFILTLSGCLFGSSVVLPLWSRLGSIQESLPHIVAQGIWPGLLGAGTAVIISRFVKRGTRYWYVGALACGLVVGALWL